MDSAEYSEQDGGRMIVPMLYTMSLCACMRACVCVRACACVCLNLGMCVLVCAQMTTDEGGGGSKAIMDID